MNEQSPIKPAPRTGRGVPWKALIMALLLLAIVMAMLWFWRSNRHSIGGYAPAGAIDVVATTLVAEPAPVRLEALGSIRAVREATLSSEAAGRVVAIGFESGRHTAAGQLLVQLEASPEQAELAAAKASSAFARQQLIRASELSGTGAVSKEILEQRQSEHDQANARIDQLTARIRLKTIRAPFAGELGLRRIDVGQYLNPGEAVVTVSDLDQLYVNFDVPQQEVLQLRVGLPVEVRSDVAGAPALNGKINAIDPRVDSDTRNAKVQALLNNKAHTLRPGMYVTVTLSMPTQANALLLPASAVMTSSAGNTAIVVRGSDAAAAGKAEIVPITTGRHIGERILVTRGLKAGDVVVTEGQLRIRPGAEVRVLMKPAIEAAPSAETVSTKG